MAEIRKCKYCGKNCYGHLCRPCFKGDKNKIKTSKKDLAK